MDEEYVAEIIDQVRKLRQPPNTFEEFAKFTAPDRRQGYAAEAEEAAKRYFAKREPGRAHG